MPRANRSEPKVSLESVHSQPPLTSIHLRRCWDCRYRTPIGLIQHCFDQWGEEREQPEEGSTSSPGHLTSSLHCLQWRWLGALGCLQDLVN